MSRLSSISVVLIGSFKVLTKSLPALSHSSPEQNLHTMLHIQSCFISSFKEQHFRRETDHSEQLKSTFHEILPSSVGQIHVFVTAIDSSSRCCSFFFAFRFLIDSTIAVTSAVTKKSSQNQPMTYLTTEKKSSANILGDLCLW